MAERATTRINRLLAEADKAAMAEVERLARNIMRRNPRLKEFVMAMGSYFFVDVDGKHPEMYHEIYHENGNTVYTYTSKAQYRTLTNFMEEYDDKFKLTGAGIRFTVDGPVVTDW